MRAIVVTVLIVVITGLCAHRQPESTDSQWEYLNGGGVRRNRVTGDCETLMLPYDPFISQWVRFRSAPNYVIELPPLPPVSRE